MVVRVAVAAAAAARRAQFRPISASAKTRNVLLAGPLRCSAAALVRHQTAAASGARLTPPEATNILRQNEFSWEEPCSSSSASASEEGPQSAESRAKHPALSGLGPVRSFDMNTLRSNSPTEDAHAEAVFRFGSSYPNAMLFGIFDGHGGAACSQVVAKRLLHYVGAVLLSPENLEQHIRAVDSGDTENLFANLLHTLNDPFELVSDLQSLYHQSYRGFLGRLSQAPASSVADRISAAFSALDEDMSTEAKMVVMTKNAEGAAGLGAPAAIRADVQMKTLTVALSGSVAVVGHVDGDMLHVASTGDCTAVLGSLSENDTWVAKKMTVEHNSDNKEEVERILAEHPGENPRDIIKGDRLLGILAPLRAFGDYRFKWSESDIRTYLADIINASAKDSDDSGVSAAAGRAGPKMKPLTVPPNYKSPPYLTASPVVSSHRLSARDKFMVMGSDGLWDMMTPTQVVRLVGEHMSGKTTLTTLELDDEETATRGLTLGEINLALQKRQAAVKLKPTDTNASTHLIRNALGSTAYGVDHGRLSQMLSLPQDMVRMFRDDMTITVVFFDTDYLRNF